MPGEASPAEEPADRVEAESEPQVGLLCAHPFVIVLDAVSDGHTPPRDAPLGPSRRSSRPDPGRGRGELVYPDLDAMLDLPHPPLD